MSNKTKVIAVIPVRMDSQRLPGKPLADLAGLPVVRRVWEAARVASTLDSCVIATDSEEIKSVAEEFGATVVMTPSSVTTGSQRVAFAAKALGSDADLIVNVQGDMPFIQPELIDQTVRLAIERPDFGMVTAATAITRKESFDSNAVVKVVISDQLQALYFSRAAIPHSRDGQRMKLCDGTEVFGYKHFGLYVFRKDSLAHYFDDGDSQLEEVEKLEQLRLLEKGVKIGVCVAPIELTKDSIEVDTPADLDAARQQLSTKQ